jgi:hypothetical protein
LPWVESLIWNWWNTLCYVYDIITTSIKPIEFFFRYTSYVCVSGWGHVFMRL